MEPTQAGDALLAEQRSDLLRRLHDGLEHDPTRNSRRAIERLGDRAGVVGHLLEGLGAVEVLATGDQPDFGLFERSEQSGPPSPAGAPQDGRRPRGRRSDSLRDYGVRRGIRRERPDNLTLLSPLHVRDAPRVALVELLRVLEKRADDAAGEDRVGLGAVRRVAGGLRVQEEPGCWAG
jgi:hypothetical protein